MKAEIGRRVYVFRRGKKGVFYTQFEVNGKRYCRTTGENDAELAQIRGQEIRDSVLVDCVEQWNKAKLCALFEDEPLIKASLKKYLAYQSNLPELLRSSITLRLKKALSLEKFAQTLTDDEKARLNK